MINQSSGLTVTLAISAGVFIAGLAGWSAGGYPGAVGGLTTGLVLGVFRWRHRQAWSWLALWARRGRPITLAVPVTVANDRSGGGVRYQDGVAAVAVQVLGKPHAPTLFTGATCAETDNTVDIAELVAVLHQSLGLTVESLSVVSAGARRRSTGDYPRVYDTMIGPPPYAGRRETWIIARIAAITNVDALRHRTSAGTAALATAQRIAATLRQGGIRARVATATDIVEMERRLGSSALTPANRRWHSVRGGSGWLTTYGYAPGQLTASALAQAWSMRVDGIVHNVTVFPDGTGSATVTVRTAQPPAAPPSMLLRPLPGEQALALTANFCGPRPTLGGVNRAPLPGSLILPVGPSGILLGKAGAGDRLTLPLDDPGELSRVHIAADDSLAKRIVVRLTASGEQVTVHTRDPRRWDSVRMPHLVVSGAARPAAGTTVSVVDGTVPLASRPNTVISIGAAGSPHGADVTITQIGPATLQVLAAGRVHTVEVELFRAENRYVSTENRVGASHP